ncbi:Nicotinic acid mononucleotide adenylyltransferase [Caminicella sporogenes DSM 14501]|uniref:Nicotinic acid mononucleotide adenylyltransferase n=1 Tax=Caminicella sporogenes DSM 14501 TaxID=1121266 RepID=A0A1M6P2Y7_9FIRM|nr:cytidyltransferase [Caminicella sporogenes]RKD21548.1 cytidyltransferase [Caminicella sporogenes]SHK02301.1 Nicotinic acid mononucleotide adenylyltransferase [Caminicella sporogenes DSM 14501]
MYNSITIELHKKIINSISDFNFLEKISIPLKIIRSFINSPSFIDKLDIIVEEKDYTCRAALELCTEMIDELVYEEKPKDLLKYFYQFALSLSFPDAVSIKLNENLNDISYIYLQVLRVLCEYQRLYDDKSWESKYPLILLSEEEEKTLESKDEYIKFKNAFYDEYIYEMMKLNQEVLGYSSLEHICGVHYLALYIGRQLKKLGLPIDLGRISGAAAGHDIGKFGCKGKELKRVPYLHYYYTGLWFDKHDIVNIRNIAVNHSTWDLELENLSLESLVLIYCDFRVKKKIFSDGKGRMHIYSLRESFDVILNKLDNVDKAKEMRYQRVYSKLKDFEDYMIDLGINVEIEKDKDFTLDENKQKKFYSLMQGDELIQNLKYIAINHNINLMYKFRDEDSLGSILEIARSERNPNNLREYLNIFEEYSTYLTQKQKLITIKFLYDKLIHPEEDIRKQCAELIGGLIALFDEVYRKEVPADVILEKPEVTSCELLDKYIMLFIKPSQNIIPLHRMWIGNNLSTLICSLFKNAREHQIEDYIKILLKYYDIETYFEKDIKLHLLNSINYIPVLKCDEEAKEVLSSYIKVNLDEENVDIRLTALELVKKLIPKLDENSKFLMYIREKYSTNVYCSDILVENFLKYKIARALKLDDEIVNQYRNFFIEDKTKLQNIYLSNLKTATDWVIKKIQMDLLVEHTLMNKDSTVIHTAMHFCNLLKVSASESVRNHGGAGLIKIMSCLSYGQRNDIAIELLRSLEIEGHQFTKYIPNYLGQIILYLQPVELDELIDDLIRKIKCSSPHVISLILQTVGIAIVNYHQYKERFEENEDVSKRRLVKLLSILLNGLVNYNLQVKQMAFTVIGKGIFGSENIDLERKKEIFQLTAKKILTLIGDISGNERMFFTNAAGLNHIYRFIADYKFYKGDLNIEIPNKIAFFPGSFDPFSLSHKEIAKSIRDMGFEVYLSIDEFSWSKRTQPNLIRRSIVEMSIADELGIYLFPKDIQINIANPNDLYMLKKKYLGNNVHIVVGSDVLLNATAYLKSKNENSIHTVSHIIIERKSLHQFEEDDKKLSEIIDKIEGNVIRLSLPSKLEDISSTQIRDYIDQNRDISRLVDPLVQKYIYDNGLYRKEPQFKRILKTKSITIEVEDTLNSSAIRELAAFIPVDYRLAYEKLKEISEKLNPRVLIMRDLKRNGEIMGFSIFHWMRASMIMKEFKDSAISEYIRNNYVGRTIVIDGIFIDRDLEFDNLEEMILTETLAFCLKKDYTYGIFKNMIKEYKSESLYEILKLYGFEEVPNSLKEEPVFVVDMTAPCTLSFDVETIIKGIFNENPNVLKAIKRTRKRLQQSIVNLYPGNLVLSFDRYMLYENMVKKICDENGVSTLPKESKVLGEAMCVPFGALLNGCIIPNTVTKSLHTEKFFEPDAKHYTIEAYPNYLSLENQVKMLRSFGRPIILVDDLLHKGYRIKALDPLLKKEKIDVKKIIVGILSGRGKELMDLQERDVDSVYFIPKLKVWFNESFMYPFINGDTLWRGVYPQRNLVPSINLILPYTSPHFIKGTSNEAIYNLSKVCIENSIDILTTLEEEYQKTYERKLTLAHLGDVYISPKYPDHGANMNYDLNINPSHYLKNDLEKLMRLEHIICGR